MAKTSPLHKVTDGNLWDAECSIFGRLCIVAHAAFIYEGFLPHGAPATTTGSLSRSYSLPQRQGDEDQVLVLQLSGRGSRRGDRGHFVLYVYYGAGAGGVGYDASCLKRRERLNRAAVAAALSGGLDQTVRALRTPGSAGMGLWKLLADNICRGLFLYVCRSNGVPVESGGFTSIPRDVKASILIRLDSAVDIAMAECASKELRDIVAEHDADLWKAKCFSVNRDYGSDGGLWWPWFWWARYDSLPNSMSWKQKYMRMRIRRRPLAVTIADAVVILRAGRPMDRKTTRNVAPADDPSVLLNVATSGPGKAASRPGVAVPPCNGYRRRHGAGAIHSPSSRYRWRHR